MNTLASRKWKMLSKKGAAVRVIQTTFYHPASARYILVYQVLTTSLTLSLSPRLPYHFPEVSVPYRNLHFFFSSLAVSAPLISTTPMLAMMERSFECRKDKKKKWFQSTVTTMTR